MNTRDFLWIQNAKIIRAGRIILDLSLKIRDGESTAVIGPNGAGKSTLLKIITRDIYPYAGSDTVVRLFDDSCESLWELRHRLGIVSNQLQFEYDPDTTGEEVILSGFFSSVGIWPCHHATDDMRNISIRSMEDLGVFHLKDRPYGILSTGEQRRFLLGRALIHDPECIVLDEPTSGLDVEATFHYLDLLRKLIQRGKTVVLVTHHIHEIPPEIERVILLKGGKVFADGAKTEILTDSMLSALFDIKLHVVERGGYYHVLPG